LKQTVFNAGSLNSYTQACWHPKLPYRSFASFLSNLKPFVQCRLVKKKEKITAKERRAIYTEKYREKNYVGYNVSLLGRRAGSF